MKHIDYLDVAKEIMNQLDHGAFLTVKASDQLNTMTIGWATMGIIWSKPIVMCGSAQLQIHFGIMEKAADFTISFPKTGMDKELSFCGSKSGRMSIIQSMHLKAILRKNCFPHHPNAGNSL
jgi:flavin reductase (DIM6/NTAB) family NADH-FMN oxidoreductase RutF